MRSVLGVGLCFGLVACGGGSGGSTGPSGGPPQVTETAPTISTPNTHIYMGQSVTFAATGTNVRWGGDAPSVATVDATTGRVSGVGNGRVTIWAENGGGRTTRLLRGLPSFAGMWRGTYAVTRCQSSGQWRSVIEFCDEFRVGEILTVALAMTQTDDRVTEGTFNLGDLPDGSLTPSVVSEAGMLAITGRATPDPSVTIALENVRLESAAAGAMTGLFEQVWASPGLTGTGRLDCELRGMTRTGGGPAIGRALFDGPMTLREAIGHVRRR